MKHVRASERTCCVCRSKAEKFSMARIVMCNRALVWDVKQCAPGRGAYVHLSADCLSKMGNAGRWEHSLHLGQGSVKREQLTELAQSLLRTVVHNDGE